MAMPTDVNLEGPASAYDTCRICGAADRAVRLEGVRDYLTEGRFAVARCRACGVEATIPQPTDLSPHYPASYRRYHGALRTVLRWVYARRMRTLGKAVGRTGRALDLGCGDGWMLQALRKQGWSVVGVERTVQSASHAATQGQLPMMVGGLEAIRPVPCLDVIIMFHVLEHLTDPLTTLRQCAERLKPNGLLVVSIPNIRSWQAVCFGRHWFHLDAPRHLFHFSPASIRRVLAAAGLHVREVRFTSWEHDPYGWVQSCLNWMGFPQNELTKMLLGLGGNRRWHPRTLIMFALAAVLTVPALCVSALSWIVGRGAILEVWASR